VYLAGFTLAPGAVRALLNLLLAAATGSPSAEGIPDNPLVECAVFPGKIVFINNADTTQNTVCHWKGQRYAAELAPCEMKEVCL